jgi:integration host factor subunit beta
MVFNIQLSGFTEFSQKLLDSSALTSELHLDFYLTSALKNSLFQCSPPSRAQLDFRKQEKGMNKSELIEALAQDINIPHREAAAITNTIINTMTEALAKGESIEIRGFGSFVIKKYDSYEGRNPKTGKKIKVKPKKLPFFKVGKDLREQVNISKK